jgi:glutamate-1-semialdehyde 2,1-aminomutase
MWGFFFTDRDVTDYATARRCDPDRFRSFFHACLRRGVYLPPSPFESCFVSLAHDPNIVHRTLETFAAIL